MRWLLLLMAALVLLLIALLVFASSTRRVVDVSRWAVESFTDYRLEVVGPVVDAVAGRLSAQELHLLTPDTDVPVVSLLEVSAGIHPRDILAANLLHSWLRADHLTVYIARESAAGDADTDTDADLSPRELLYSLGWLPRELELASAHLVVDLAQTQIVQLAGVRGERLPESYYSLTASGFYEGDQLQLTTQLHTLLRGERFDGFELQATLGAPASRTRFELQGQLRGTSTDFEYDFGLRAQSEDMARFLRGLVTVPDLGGNLSLQGRMNGDGSGFRLADVRAALDKLPSYKFSAQGALSYLVDGGSAIELTANGELDSVQAMLGWLNLESGEFGRAHASLVISGSLAQPVVDEFALETSNASGLELNFQGRLDSPFEQGRAGIDGNEITVAAHGPELAVLEPWLGDLPVELGAWRASGRLVEQGELLSMEGLVINTGEPGGLEISAQGSIGDLAAVVDAQLAGVRNIEVSLVATAPDATLLAELLEREELVHHRLAATLQLTGDGTLLHGIDGEIRFESDDLAVIAGPVSLAVAPGAEEFLLTLVAPFEMSLSDTSALSQYTLTEMPVLGPVEARGRVVKNEGSPLSLEGLSLEMTGNELSAVIDGSIENLVTLQGVELEVGFEEADIRELLRLTLDDYDYRPALGKLQGSFRLEDSGESWNIDNLKLRGGYDSGPLELSVRGRIADLSGAVAADLQADFHLRDPLLLEVLSGLRVSPVQGSIELASSLDTTRMLASGRIGNSPLDGSGFIKWQGEAIRKVRLALESTRLQLGDLGLQSTEQQGGDYRPAERMAGPDSLQSVVAMLPEYPFDIAVKVGHLSGEHTNIRNLDVHFTGESKRYTVRRLKADYDGAAAEFNGVLDLMSGRPALSVGGQAQLLPLNVLSRDLALDSNLNGYLSVLGGLTAFGADTEEQMASLQGNLALAIEDMVVEGAAYDVLAADLLGWFYSGAALEESTDINCAMGRFAIDAGVAASESLYVETDRMLATGVMGLDLVQQSLGLTLTPWSKSRMLQVPSAVSVKGPLSDLQPQISPVSAAFDAYSAWLTLVPQLALEVFGFQGNVDDKHRPCQT